MSCTYTSIEAGLSPYQNQKELNSPMSIRALLIPVLTKSFADQRLRKSELELDEAFEMTVQLLDNYQISFSISIWQATAPPPLLPPAATTAATAASTACYLRCYRRYCRRSSPAVDRSYLRQQMGPHRHSEPHELSCLRSLLSFRPYRCRSLEFIQGTEAT